MLKSLLIQNFRGLEDFYVPKLGQINLIVGKNSSGKSSVLEALRIYAGNGNKGMLQEIASSHGEKSRYQEILSDDESDDFPFQAFFTGRAFPKKDDVAIVIGEAHDAPDLLKIEHILLEQYEDNGTDEVGSNFNRIRYRIRQKDNPDLFEGSLPISGKEITYGLQIKKGDRSIIINFETLGARGRPYSFELSSTVPCSIVPTRFVSLDDLARNWDDIVLTEHADFVKNALKEVSHDVEDFAFVEDTESEPSYGRRTSRRTIKVKIAGSSRGVPIDSLGEGLFRVLQLMLKIFPAKGGFLLIDEFENGLHYSVQESIWSLIFEQAKKLNVQVFATTHSLDCVKSFSAVAKERQDVDGVLFRVGKSVLKSEAGKTVATVFNGVDLYNVTYSDLEVR